MASTPRAEGIESIIAGAFVLAGLAAAVLGLGAASASAATVTAAARPSAVSQISELPPDPCSPAVIPPNPR